MKTALFSFSTSLQNLLAREKRITPYEYLFTGPQTVKHLIESLGIPHTEIGQVFANEQLVGLGYLVRSGDRVEVHPASLLDDGPASSSEPRFVIDGHLGRLASHLRMLGLDCLYNVVLEDNELVRISLNENRILLTRDRRLLMHKVITQGYLLRSLNSTEQLREVVKRYELTQWVKPFQRCMRCNNPLESVEKINILDRLEPLTKKYFNEFHICPACDQIYWKGSHYTQMLSVITKFSPQ